jgi:hypothetical protein
MKISFKQIFPGKVKGKTQSGKSNNKIRPGIEFPLPVLCDLILRCWQPPGQ